MKQSSEAEKVPSLKGRTPSAIRTGGRPTTWISLTSAGITSNPSSRSSRAERCPVPEPRSSTGPSLGSHAPTCSMSWRERRSMTALNSEVSITRPEQARGCARCVPCFEERLDEPEDLRPETSRQVSGMNRQGRDSTTQGLKQPPDPMTEVPEPAPATTVPGEGCQGNTSPPQ